LSLGKGHSRTYQQSALEVCHGKNLPISEGRIDKRVGPDESIIVIEHHETLAKCLGGNVVLRREMLPHSPIGSVGRPHVRRTSFGLNEVIYVVVDSSIAIGSISPSAVNWMISDNSPGRSGDGQVDNAVLGPFGPVGGHYESRGMGQGLRRTGKGMKRIKRREG